MKFQTPSALNPVKAEHFGEIVKSLHGMSAQAHRVARAQWHTIDGHRVGVAYCLDDDAYSGWTDNDRLIGIDFKTEDESVFVEEFLFRRKELTLVRFRAAPIHELIEKVVVIDGAPSLPANITETERMHHWHAMNDATVGSMGRSIDSSRNESALYKRVCGSSFIIRYLTQLGVSEP